MDTLNVKTGGVIEIMGNRTNFYKSRSVAKFFPLYAHDEGQGIIRLDALLADNAGTAISGIENKKTVMVRRISTVPAERVVVSPLETLTSAPLTSNYLTNALDDVPIMRGDNVHVPFYDGRLTFRVTSMKPDVDAVLSDQINLMLSRRICGS
jgi:transitional endoplasmic reticulum ATPase